MEWWNELHEWREPGEMMPRRLTVGAIDAWSRLTGREVGPWHLACLLVVEAHYFNAFMASHQPAPPTTNAGAQAELQRRLRRG